MSTTTLTQALCTSAAGAWVLWVHVSNATRFEQSYRDIADRLKVLGRDNLKANIFKLVHDRLCDSARGTWVLVLDNVKGKGR